MARTRATRCWIYLIRLVGIIVPCRLRGDWRQEWEAELSYREAQLAKWDILHWQNKLDLWRRSLGAFKDALCLLPQRWEDAMIQDFRYAVRMLRKQPGFTFMAVITLALGIGANTAIFSVADKLLLRSLPVKNPEQLVQVSGETVNPKFQNNIFTYPDYVDYRAQTEVFDGLLAYLQSPVRLGEGERSDKINLELISDNYFEVLGVTAAQGRVIQSEDNRNEDSHPVAVISHHCWQRRLGGRRDAIGQTLQLNGAPYTIIGIAPVEFTGMRLEIPTEVWVPLMMRRQLLGATTSIFERKGAWLRLVGRLKSDITLAAAQVSFDLTARRVWMANTTESDRKLPFNEKRILLEPGGQGLSSLRRAMGESLKLLLGIVALLLVLACANVANLMLARAASRRKEMALRLALGASRLRIVRQLLCESLLLSLLGAGVGLILAPWLYEMLFAFQPGFELDRSAMNHSLDARVLGFTLLTALVSCVLFGLAPALQSARGDLTPVLKDADLGATPHERHWNVRNALVVTQVALALVLLIGAGLLVRSLQRRWAIEPGFRTENLLIVPLELPRTAYAAAMDEAGKRAVEAQNLQYFTQVAERVKRLPGVAAVTLGTITPFSNSIGKISLVVEGWQPKPGQNLAVDNTAVGPGYHETLGIPFVAGRGFTERDNSTAPGVAIVNETFARTFFPGQNPLGKRLSTGVRGQPWLEIVGVTRDYRLHDLTEAPFPHLDLPMLQRPIGSFARLVIRTNTEPLALFAAVRRVVLASNAQVSIETPTTLNDEVKSTMAVARMASTLTSLFGLTALLLAAIGLYGVMSYTTSRRTREIGIRMALGADQRTIIRLVIQQSICLTIIGIALGLLVALSLTRLLQSLLYGVSMTDPVTLVGVVLLLALVALFACFAPAFRAVKVDPMRALRHE